MRSLGKRPTFKLAIFGFLICTGAVAQAARDECKTVESAQAYLASYESVLQNTRAGIKSIEAKREESINELANTLIANGTWNAEEKKEFFSKVVASRKYQDAEKQKNILINKYEFSLPMAFGLKAKRPTGACEFAHDSISELMELGKINQMQYDLMDSLLSERVNAKK